MATLCSLHQMSNSASANFRPLILKTQSDVTLWEPIDKLHSTAKLNILSCVGIFKRVAEGCYLAPTCVLWRLQVNQGEEYVCVCAYESVEGTHVRGCSGDAKLTQKWSEERFMPSESSRNPPKNFFSRNGSLLWDTPVFLMSVKDLTRLLRGFLTYFVLSWE